MTSERDADDAARYRRWRQALRVPRKRKAPMTDEERANRSAAQRRRFERPEEREKIKKAFALRRAQAVEAAIRETEADTREVCDYLADK